MISATENLIKSSAEKYQRRLHLGMLLGNPILDTGEFKTADILCALEKRLNNMRTLGNARHSAYSLTLHIALCSAVIAEKSILESESMEATGADTMSLSHHVVAKTVATDRKTPGFNQNNEAE